MMNGKILKISSNDLYGNVDERQVVVFACFNHIKYMNKYILFTFLGEYDKKKLYYGSVHMKDNSLVVFSVKENVFGYIDKFKNEYIEGKVDDGEYEILDISKMEKIELVSYSEMDSDQLNTLEEISLKKDNENDIENDKKKKPVFLYILLIILILLLVGITYLYLRPDDFVIVNKKLTCEKDRYNQEIEMNYQENREILFDRNDKVKKIEVQDKYIFDDVDLYNQFKDNELEKNYFKIDGTFKYIDESLELKIIYQEESIIDNYEEMKDYLMGEKYSCIEGTYEE